jgi:hypothetical protein
MRLDTLYHHVVLSVVMLSGALGAHAADVLNEASTPDQ